MKTQYQVQTVNPKTRWAFETYKQTKDEAVASAKSAIQSGLTAKVYFEKIYKSGHIKSVEVK